ncbi:uncharacterized protein LOC129618200, partial [Condylostylus longicornis]|uniref:uncharacterized protein LOC129618200 n=1 Tax=Condylostylus longicornis TaxID=2530218 RepID=UPI00244E1E97
MGATKRRAPSKSAHKPPVKRRAVLREAENEAATSKQSSKNLEREDEQFEDYLKKLPVAQQKAFAVDLIDSDGSDRDVVDGEKEVVENVGDDDDEAKHEKELEELKTADPEFYQFLLENDRQLLEFGKELDETPDEQDDDKEQQEDKTSFMGSKLTIDRFEAIFRNAKESESTRSLTLLLAAYRGVIRSITRMEETEDNGKLKEEKKKHPMTPAKLLFHLDVEDEDDEAFEVFNEVVSSVAQHIGTMLEVRLPSVESSREDIRIVFPPPGSIKTVFVTLINQFWIDTTLLLKYYQGKVTAEGVQESKQSDKMTPTELNDTVEESQQSVMSECYRAFMLVVKRRGYSWAVAPGYQFILNCLSELLRSVRSSVAYRVIFLVVRQLSLIARNALIARSQQRMGLQGASADAAVKVRSKRLPPSASDEKRFDEAEEAFEQRDACGEIRMPEFSRRDLVELLRKTRVQKPPDTDLVVRLSDAQVEMPQ